MMKTEELQYLLVFTEKIINNIYEIKEQSELQDTELYWTGIRIQNNRIKFKEIDVESIDRLRETLDSVLYIQNQMLKLAEDIQIDAKVIISIQKEVEEESNNQQDIILEKMQAINEKVDLLQKLFYRYSEKQQSFIADIKNTESLFRKRIPKRRMALLRKLRKCM